MSVIHATCLRCGHEGDVSPESLNRFGRNATMAYLSRFMKCDKCGSKAVKLERRETGGSQQARSERR